jgi:soluble lytic murein transglycosylase
VIKEESKFSKYAISPVGAVGLMQLMPRTARLLARELKMPNYEQFRLYEPEVNIELGTYYLSKLLKQFNGELMFAIAAYNAGDGAAASWKKRKISNPNDIPYRETRYFVRKVLRNYTFLKTVREFL